MHHQSSPVERKRKQSPGRGSSGGSGVKKRRLDHLPARNTLSSIVGALSSVWGLSRSTIAGQPEAVRPPTVATDETTLVSTPTTKRRPLSTTSSPALKASIRKKLFPFAHPGRSSSSAVVDAPGQARAVDLSPSPYKSTKLEKSLASEQERDRASSASPDPIAMRPAGREEALALVPAPRGRTRTPSRRLVESMQHSQVGSPKSPQIRGILTPSRQGKRLSLQKSVTFSAKSNSKTTLLSPIKPANRSRKHTGKTASVAHTRVDSREKVKHDHGKRERASVNDPSEHGEWVQDKDKEDNEDSDDTDDEVCVLCLKPDSKAPNQILFCDRCDKGYHQACSSVRTIPKGNWLCRNCNTAVPQLHDTTQARILSEGQELDKDEILAKGLENGHEDEREEEEDDDDDEICCICSKPDSKPPNEIIFCDRCDLAYHQVCDKVPKVPKGEWICRKCKEAGSNPSEVAGSPAGLGTSAALARVPRIPNLQTHLNHLQRILVDRCTGQRKLKLIGHDDEYAMARQLVRQTVLTGEGNSMLIIGPRSCGKTTLVEGILSELSLHHSDHYLVVRLNGLIHTDDKLAVKEIWRQLGKEMGADELMGHRSYADTLSSLLALLAHPSEHTGRENESDSEQESDSEPKAVVFVIDEFDMFTSHPRQALLYNLFDIAQSRKVPIVVLGCTPRLDVVELLEKRVKSRFSHRYVYLPMPGALSDYWQICRQGLVVDPEDAKAEGMDCLLEGHDEFMLYWRRQTEALQKTDQFQSLLRFHYYSSKSVPDFLMAWILPLASVSAKRPSLVTPRAPWFMDVIAHEAHEAGQEAAEEPRAWQQTSLQGPDSRLHLLASLSELELALIIVAARLDVVAHRDTVNFAMAYEEYSTLMGRQRVQLSSSGLLAAGGSTRVWGREVAMGAWEHMVALGLLRPAAISAGSAAAVTGGTGTGAGAGAGAEGKMWRPDVALEDVARSVKLNQVLARWCKEL